jgi:Flp pilus assembly protein TadB
VSKERARARAARQEARRQEVEAAAASRARRERRDALRRTLTPTLPRRRRRFDSLTTRAWAQLVLVFAAVQAVVWFFVPGYGPRAAAAVLTLASLAVIVTTRRRPVR